VVLDFISWPETDKGNSKMTTMTAAANPSGAQEWEIQGWENQLDKLRPEG
jgi:hypothetical protein